MGFINEWLGNQHIISVLIVFVVAFNLFLSGLSGALKLIKDKTVSTADDKALVIVDKIISILQKAIDWVGYNPAHK